MFVCWFVCLLFIGHTTFVHFAALPPSGREQDQPSSRAAPRARASACTARARARMPYNFSTKKSLRWCLSKTKPYARAYCRIRNCRDSQKKGKRKPTCHFPSSVYSLPSLGVFTFRIVLNRILHKSSLLAPMESRRTRRPTFTAEERLERRREQDRRRHAWKASRGKTGADTGPEGCGSPAVFTPRNTATTRWSTKNTIMTVHVNPITQAAPSQRRIISISEASNQFLFHYQKFFVEWICWRINIFLKSCSRSKKLQPGGKPNSFAFRNPGRPRRSINCSRDGSRTASRFAIQVNRDGRSNCSQLGSRPSPANKLTGRKASTGKTGADTGPEGCGSPTVFTPRNTATTRWSTNNIIMTVQENLITQAAPSQRRIISISEASNQLLFHSQKFFVEWICFDD